MRKSKVNVYIEKFIDQPNKYKYTHDSPKENKLNRQYFIQKFRIILKLVLQIENNKTLSSRNLGLNNFLL